MSEYALKAGDLLPSLRVQLLDGNGTAINLTELSVTARFKLDGASAATERAASIEPGTDGYCALGWEDGDTDDAGLMRVEFTIDHGSGEQTVPPNGYVAFRIHERLA